MHRPESSKHGNKGLFAKRLVNSKILQLPQIPENTPLYNKNVKDPQTICNHIQCSRSIQQSV